MDVHPMFRWDSCLGPWGNSTQVKIMPLLTSDQIKKRNNHLGPVWRFLPDWAFWDCDPWYCHCEYHCNRKAVTVVCLLLSNLVCFIAAVWKDKFYTQILFFQSFLHVWWGLASCLPMSFYMNASLATWVPVFSSMFHHVGINFCIAT